MSEKTRVDWTEAAFVIDLHFWAHEAWHAVPPTVRGPGGWHTVAPVEPVLGGVPVNTSGRW